MTNESNFNWSWSLELVGRTTAEQRPASTVPPQWASATAPVNVAPTLRSHHLASSTTGTRGLVELKKSLISRS